MKAKITEMIEAFVQNYGRKERISTRWGRPGVGFADARHPCIADLKTIISPTHSLPADVLPEATVVVAYFLPFTRELAATNRIPGDPASPQWARAYEETNALFPRLNAYLIDALQDRGYRAAVSPEASVFDRDQLRSNWSHRHFAKAAGLGTFGVNNMLITGAGCCGRYYTLVTNLDVLPDAPLETEYCLYKKNGSCGVCVRRCPAGALTLNGYNRYRCYEICRENARRYTEFGSSYTGESAGEPQPEEQVLGSEVCGKCVVGVPCAFLKMSG